MGQKAYRALRLLIGLRNPRVTALMVAHGFTQADLQDGLQRLGALTGMRLNLHETKRDRALVIGLDEFENTWFPVARATLAARYPEIGQVLFLNLSQYTGVEVVVSVSIFLERLEQMAKGEGDFGEKGPEARALLAQRGLTDGKVQEAQAQLDAIGTLSETPVHEGPSVEEQRAAEDHLWAWYLEWSAIARVAIKDGRLLRSLGFNPRTRSSDIETPDATPTAAPATALPVAPTVPLLNVVNQ